MSKQHPPSTAKKPAFFVLRMMFVLCALMMTLPALAQSPTNAPVCNAASQGTVSCIDTVLCLCRFQRAGTLTNVDAGHRWNCDLKRPRCGAASIYQPHSRSLSGSRFFPDAIEVHNKRGTLIVPIPKPR